MKIYAMMYREYINGKRENTIVVETVEARETEKAYILQNSCCTKRKVVKKSEIGKCISDINDVVFYLTPDTERFRGKIKEHVKNRIEKLKIIIKVYQNAIKNVEGEKFIMIERERNP